MKRVVDESGERIAIIKKRYLKLMAMFAKAQNIITNDTWINRNCNKKQICINCDKLTKNFSVVFWKFGTVESICDKCLPSIIKSVRKGRNAFEVKK